MPFLFEQADIEVSTSDKELVSNNEFDSSDEFGYNDANEISEQSETVNKEAKAVTWIECFGRLSHLCCNLMECRELISKVEKLDVPQPESLLEELLDVVERLHSLSSSLLSDTNQALANPLTKMSKLTLIADCEKVQQPLTNLECWSRNNNLDFNSSKCKVHTITRKKISVDVCLPNELESSIACRERERSWCLRQ